MNALRRVRYSVFALLCVAGNSVESLAQVPGESIEDRLAKIEAATAGAQSAGDNAWVLVCAALVLMMTGPGLALFYCGLVRKKNVLSTMMQSFILMALVRYCGPSTATVSPSLKVRSSLVAWVTLLLQGVSSTPNSDYAATIPQQTFMLFQLMFAIITPALITGAFAERIKFSAMMVFTVLWAPVFTFPWRTWSGAREDS